MEQTQKLVLGIRAIFTSLMLVLVIALFTLSVTFRETELEALGEATRRVSATWYRISYVAGGGTASVLGAFSPKGNTSYGRAGSIPVLLYHGITTESDRFSLTEGSFASQMFALKRAGYETLTLSEFESYLQGRKEIPEKSFLLTFDDGRNDSYERADPILEALNYKAVMFVASGASVRNTDDTNHYYLNERDLKRMVASGRWEIGSHAVQEEGGILTTDGDGAKGNFLSSKEWRAEDRRIETESEYRERIAFELEESKAVLESLLPVEIRTFSYPFGDWGNQETNNPSAEQVIRNQVEDTYVLAFRQVWERDGDMSENYPEREDVYQLRRIEVPTDWQGEDLLTFLSGTASKTLPYVESFSTPDERWKYNWGVLNVSGDSLKLFANSTSTGAFSFLDGTRAWDNYRYTVHATWSPQSAVSLVVRYQNDSTYASCTFSPEGTFIDYRVNGTIVRAASEQEVSRSNSDVSVGVEDEIIVCHVAGAEVVRAALPVSLSEGGIGLRTWAKEPGTASLSVTKLQVEPITP